MDVHNYFLWEEYHCDTWLAKFNTEELLYSLLA